jgi:hypothetical protein
MDKSTEWISGRPRYETEIGSRVVAWLREMGWTVYQEVKALDADIVAVLGRLGWIIECKRCLNLKVIDQALKRIGWVQFVSIAIPECDRPYTFKPLFDHYGIGVVLSNPYETREWIRLRFRRQKISSFVLDNLSPRQLDYCVAGSTGGRPWSDFKDTVEKLRQLVEANPGIPLKEALTQIEHHYSSLASAKRSLAHWIERGKVSGIRSERERCLRLYPVRPTIAD